MITLKGAEHLCGIDGRGGHTEKHRQNIPVGKVVLKKAHAWERRPTNKENQQEKENSER